MSSFPKSAGLFLLLVTGWSAGYAQVSYTISTVAGSTYSGDGGPAALGILSQPEGVAVDARGNVYVADAVDHRVRKIAPDGTIRTVAGNGLPGFTGDDGPAEAAQLNAPYGVCLDRNGNLFIADLGNARVRKISPDGTISTVAGGGSIVPGGDGDGGPAAMARLAAPRNVTTDAAGNLYVSDFSGQRVLKVDLNGTLTTVAGTGTAGYTADGAAANSAMISYPAGLAMDRADVLYIADTGSKRIRKVYRGVISTVGSLSLNVPTGLAVDRLDNLYIADGRTVVTRVSPQGAVSTLAIGGGDMAVDAFDNVYASGAHMVRRLGSGAVTVVAGSGNSSFAGDGQSAATSRLNAPAGLARDAAGSLVFADAQNNRVRKLSAQGVLSTIAGTGITNPLPSTRPTAVSLAGPASVAFDSSGNLFFAERSANRIRRVSPDDTISTVAGSDVAGYAGDDGPAVKALLNSPAAIAIDRENNLYIADTGNNRIRKITPGGQISTVAAQLTEPMGVATDKNGNVYIAETGANRIRILTRTGLISTLIGSSSVLMNQPRGLRVTDSGELVLASSGNNRILKMSVAGEVSTIAGTGIAGLAGDGGSADSAQVSGPVDVELDADGSVWIADTGNNRIRKLTPVAAPLPVTLNPLTMVHGATLREQAVAPGTIVTVFGSELGPVVGVKGQITAAGTLETQVGGVRVFFDGIAAPLFFAQDQQINAQVPYEVAGHVETEVKVVSGDVVKGSVRVPVKDAAPGILTAAGGTGQAIASNENGGVNSDSNPAARGSVVTLYATGDGQLGPDAVDGVPAVAAWTGYPVSVDFGGYAGEVLYAGRAPGFIGLMQISVRIPASFVQAGAVPVWLTVNGQTSQNGVVLSVR